MNTKSLNLIWILFLIFFSNPSAQVKIKSVYASNELCGTFCKTNLEITFFNPTNSDSLQGTFNFKTLENSFIKEMWLEINGEFVNAESLSRKTARRIYNRIVGRRIDPALLIKMDNGKYSLNVFPVNSKKERVVRIELYSVLEGKTQNLTHWFLEHTPTSYKYLDIIYSLPENSYINYGKYFSNKKSISEVNNGIINGTINKTEVEALTFDIYLGNEKFIVKNDNFTFLTELRPSCIFKIKNNSDFTKNINQINSLLKNKDHVFIQNESPSIFIKKFLDYLNQTSNLFQNYNSEFPSCFKINEDWNFINDNYSVSQVSKPTYYESEIKCQYLSNYVNYNELLFKDKNAKINSGFLYKKLAKLVIEETDKRAVNIKEQELVKEDLEDKEIGFDSNEEIPVEFFVAVERMPQPIGGIKGMQRKLYYPQLYVDAGIQGRVYVKALIDTTGFVMKAEIIKGIANVLDSIALKAVKSTRFIPGRQRNKNVKMQVTVPLKFIIGETPIGNNYQQNTIEEVEIENKIFNAILNVRNKWMMIDEFYSLNKNDNFKYLSEKSFKLLQQNPDKIKYILTALEDYSFDEIGLVINGKSYLFKRK